MQALHLLAIGVVDLFAQIVYEEVASSQLPHNDAEVAPVVVLNTKSFTQVNSCQGQSQRCPEKQASSKVSLSVTH